MIVILTEKPSAGRNFAEAFGGMKGKQYQIAASRGHLFEFIEPAEQVSPEKKEKYKKWGLQHLPWDPEDLKWEKSLIKTGGASEAYEKIRKAFNDADEVVIATDVDPSGEGELLAWEIIIASGYKGLVSRMYFLDEMPESIRKAFMERKSVTASTDGDYIKSDVRSRWDFLSMQFTRAASCIAMECGYNRVLRQGRLKSVMVHMVGMQEDAVRSYVKKPYYEARYKDDLGNIFSRKVTKTMEETLEPYEYGRFEEKSAVDLTSLNSCATIVIDDTQEKRTAPGKLLDLAGIASILASRGFKPEAVLKTYQAMYEDKILSYPRTEDKTITPEQFNQLLPLVDSIADIVGVDKDLLTHRQPRKSHVKAQGAHGANRPGTILPQSLEALKKYGDEGPVLYEIIAKNYLAMLCEDYEYILQKGHIKEAPEFIGTASKTLSLGFKAVFDSQASLEDDEKKSNESQLLGKTAEPFIYEGANKKPQKPTMKWLRSRLEKYNVGTGATRTQTLSEITKPDKKRGLMNEVKGVLSLTENGRLSYCLIGGCEIASADTTEELFSKMEKVGAFAMDPQEVIGSISQLVVHDIEVMQKNKEKLIERFGKGSEMDEKIKVRGTYKPTGEKIMFKPSWGSHAFTDSELRSLFNGEIIEFDHDGKYGSYKVCGRLAEQEYKGKTFWGFKKE